MPANKDFKRLVRARMEKTGEAYTTARAQLMKSAPASASASPAAPAEVQAAPAIAPPRYAALAGMSDAALKKATGCDWEHWVFALDRVGAASWSHRAIADYVHHTYKVPDWWTQTLTVGYERIKGLRAIGQRRDGGYEASKSKTIAAPAATVYRAFTDARVRRRWLPGVKVVVRTSIPHRSVRMTWDDGTPVEVWITAKGPRRASAQVQHRKLGGKEDADRRRAFWSERLTALGEALTG